MNHQKIIDRFFKAYSKRDINSIQEVMSDKVIWHFPGHHYLSGVKHGIEEVIEFFDQMSVIMGKSVLKSETLVTGENENLLVECQHVVVKRQAGITLDHKWCVLWRFDEEKIKEGTHFASDQHEVDRFFHKVSQEIHTH